MGDGVGAIEQIYPQASAFAGLRPLSSVPTAFPAPACGSIVMDNVYKDEELSSKTAHMARVEAMIAGFLDQAPHSSCAGLKKSSLAMLGLELEYISGLMINLKPETYVEWGTGMSSQWYPLLAWRSLAIDHVPAWCDQVGGLAVPSCLTEKGAFTMSCAQGVPMEKLGEFGTVSPDLSPEEKETVVHDIFEAYVENGGRAVADTFGAADSVDFALVDGRFRVACALRLLPMLRERAVVVLHDFWARVGAYKDVFRYYDVIGAQQSVVALRKKPESQLPGSWRTDYLKYNNLAGQA